MEQHQCGIGNCSVIFASPEGLADHVTGEHGHAWCTQCDGKLDLDKMEDTFGIYNDCGRCNPDMTDRGPSYGDEGDW